MKITNEIINRINQLAQKAKLEGLTEDEKEEQQRLRQAYAAACRANLRATLEHTVIVGPDGVRRPLKK